LKKQKAGNIDFPAFLKKNGCYLAGLSTNVPQALACDLKFAS
jgi:hypothetical protein